MLHKKEFFSIISSSSNYSDNKDINSIKVPLQTHVDTQIQNIIRTTINSAEPFVQQRNNAFEVLGYDIMLDDS